MSGELRTRALRGCAKSIARVGRRCLALSALGLASVGMAYAAPPSSASKEAAVAAPPKAVTQRCSYYEEGRGYEDDAPCELVAETLPDGAERLTYRTAKNRIVFEGRSGAGWLDGKLNGRPGAGYQLNSRHTVFRTVDLSIEFETWQAGYEHGRYSAPRAPGRDEPDVSCVFSDAPRKAVACREGKDKSGRLVYQAGDRKVVLDEGKYAGPWWWTKLNGQPAVGYELNKGHGVFSTTDFKTHFEFWYASYRTGSY